MASITERTAAPLPLLFEVEDVPEDEIKRYLDLGFEEYTQLVRTKPIPSYFRPAYARLASAFYHFEFRPDDIVVLTYPKSGTSWTSELVWALKNPGALHLAEEVPSSDRVFFIDMDMLRPTRAAEDNPVYRRFVAACPEGRVEDGVQLQLAAAHKGPRIIKTHLRFDLLRQDLLDTCKVVYTIRNPKDTCVSYFHHSSNNKWHAFKGEFAHFAEAVMGNGILYGSYWEHVRQAWQRKGHRNLHVMFYENMKADIHGELRNLANFLQLDRDDDQLKTVADHASFDSMRSRHERVNVNHGIRNFFRKGQVGDWKNAATGDLNERMDAWIRENSHGIDIPFRYD